MCGIYFNKGKYYFEKDLLKEALKELKLALNLSAKMNFPFYYWNISRSIAYIYITSNQIKDAIPFPRTMLRFKP